MKRNILLIVTVFMLHASIIGISAKNVFDAVVAQDGTGNFSNIQDAIDAAPENSNVPYLIFIKAGRYHEHVLIPENKPYIHLIGQDKKLVRVFDDRVSGGKNASPVDVAATMVVHAPNVYIEGITLENSWGTRHNGGPQALALYTKKDRIVVNNCGMLSYQDTYRTADGLNERNYVKDCFIEGAVDFIYGQGNVFFDNCTLNITRKQGGYIVAPKHGVGTTWGYVLKNTTITAPENPKDTKVWLGRPWKNAPKAVFIDTRAEVTIPEKGWCDHMGALPEIFADYNTVDSEGNAVDLSKRIDRYYKLTENRDTLWGKAKNNITASEIVKYTVGNVMVGDDGWNPEELCRRPAAPKVMRRGTKLAWKPVENALGYIVINDDKVVGITTNCQFQVAVRTGAYDVKAVSANGTTSM